MTRRDRTRGDDPLTVLGLSEPVTAEEIVEARRRLAKSAHPDLGGDMASMQRLNAAAEQALAELGGGADPRPAQARAPEPTPAPPPPDGRRVDHPSFTVEALPAEAFEALLVVASWLGDVIDDDPPYRLEIQLRDPVRGWCRLDVVPDAGASTVSLTVAAEPGWPRPGLDEVRDRWVESLNRLDWARLGDSPLRPS